MTAAVEAIGCLFAGVAKFFPHPIQLVTLAAIEAQGVAGIAVQFDHVFRGNSRDLMQVINVLRDHRRNLADPVEARQRAMSAPGFGKRKLRVHSEASTP